MYEMHSQKCYILKTQKTLCLSCFIFKCICFPELFITHCILPFLTVMQAQIIYKHEKLFYFQTIWKCWAILKRKEMSRQRQVLNLHSGQTLPENGQVDCLSRNKLCLKISLYNPFLRKINKRTGFFTVCGNKIMLNVFFFWHLDNSDGSRLKKI